MVPESAGASLGAEAAPPEAAPPPELVEEMRGAAHAVIRSPQVLWQYGYLERGSGVILELEGRPRIITPRMRRRQVAVIGEWQEVPEETDDGE